MADVDTSRERFEEMDRLCECSLGHTCPPCEMAEFVDALLDERDELLEASETLIRGLATVGMLSTRDLDALCEAIASVRAQKGGDRG